MKETCGMMQWSVVGLKETACERNVWNDAVEGGGGRELFNNTFHVSDGSQRGSKSK